MRRSSATWGSPLPAESNDRGAAAVPRPGARGPAGYRRALGRLAHPDRPDPAGRRRRALVRRGRRRVLGRHHLAAGGGRDPADGDRLADRGRDRRRDGHADRLGAGARRVPGQADRQRPDRPPVRAADDRRRPRPARAVRTEWAGRHQRGLYAGGRAARAAVRDAAVRRARGPAGADRPRARGRGGRRIARRRRVHDVPPDHPAGAAAGDPGGCRPGVRARGRRVRLDHPHQREPAVQDRGRVGARLRADRERQHHGAAAVSVFLLAVAFVVLLGISFIARRGGGR